MIKIAHIIPHFGTGVGTVVRPFAEFNKDNLNYMHQYFVLEDLNELTKIFFNKNKIKYFENCFNKKKFLLKKMKTFEIILIHWWNHPLLMYLLVKWKFPKNRMIIWCHITGQIAPNCFTKEILEFPDRFIFTTPISKKTTVYKNLSFKKQKERCGTIWSTGGIERVKILKQRKNKKFIVGYIGNLDFTKLNPNFVKMCEDAYKKNFVFIVIGKLVKNELSEQIKNSKIASKIILTGYVSEKKKWKLLNTFDVFGYPLARHHFGSCDQSIQEAMAAQVPVLCLNNSMEKYMIKNNKTGFIVKNEKDYSKFLKKFNQIKKKKILKIKHNALKFAQENFSINQMNKEWNEVFVKILKKKKNDKKYLKSSMTIDQIYKNSLTDDCKIVKKFLSVKKVTKKIKSELLLFCNSKNWLSPTKSSPFHFNKFFPDNKKISRLCNILLNIKN